MKLHEHQAKDILRTYGLPVPEGRVAFSLPEVRQAAEELKEFPLVVKAQVHCGGRGKAGGVKIAANMGQLLQTAQELLGSVLQTVQCPEGKPVNRLWIEKKTAIAKEFYLGITLDRTLAQPVLMASAFGGMDIEEIVRNQPEALLREPIDPACGLMPFQARKLAASLGLPIAAFVTVATALARLFLDRDAFLVEVNPLVLTEDGELILLDAKLEIEANALPRQQDLKALEDLTQINRLEVEAQKHKLNYMKLDGNIGCMVNGAGLAMTTMDIIKLAGGNPANFLDVGGGASAEQITAAFRILMADTDVKAVFINIFGGILRCDRLAQGMIEAAKIVDITAPIIVRMEGTNVAEGRRLLTESGLRFVTADNMWEGAVEAVRLAQQGGERDGNSGQ